MLFRSVGELIRPCFNHQASISVNITTLAFRAHLGEICSSALLHCFPHLIRLELDVDKNLGRSLESLKVAEHGDVETTGPRASECPCLFLRELVVWAEVPKGKLRALLESPNMSDLEGYVTQRLQQFRNVLESRASSSPSASRLTYLELFEYEEHSLKPRRFEASTHDISSIRSEAIGASLKDLYAFVDGEIVLKGFRYYTGRVVEEISMDDSSVDDDNYVNAESSEDDEF